MKEFLDEYLSTILSIIIVILAVAIIAILVFDIKLPKKEEEVNETSDVALKETKEEVNLPETSDTVDTKYYVDIKGAVKKPGVYEVSKEMIINDVIKMAGGLKSNASTKYLNLSKKVTNEMVINIFTTTEIKNMDITSEKECNAPTEDIKDCASATVVVTDSNSNQNNSNSSNSNNSSSTDSEPEKETPNTTPSNNKVNINTASLNELMSVSGIGEAKAKAIIEYRTTKGLFKSIEEIKNVSGIGDALYAKIKDSITV